MIKVRENIVFLTKKGFEKFYSIFAMMNFAAVTFLFLHGKHIDFSHLLSCQLINNLRMKCREEDLLNLKWRDFMENTTSSFRTLWEGHEFADVTLVCEDGQHVEAHKAVLASSSPFFLNLLRENQNPHPLILMTDLKSETVLAMVDFFYHGETNVDEEEVKIFLAAAEELKIKGLANLDEQFKSQTNSKK